MSNFSERAKKLLDSRPMSSVKLDDKVEQTKVEYDESALGRMEIPLREIQSQSDAKVNLLLEILKILSTGEKTVGLMWHRLKTTYTGLYPILTTLENGGYATYVMNRARCPTCGHKMSGRIYTITDSGKKLFEFLTTNAVKQL